jgi:hypothetical protein
MVFALIAYGFGFCLTFVSLLFVFVSSIAWMDTSRVELAKSIAIGSGVIALLSAIFPATWLILLTAKDSEVL